MLDNQSTSAYTDETVLIDYSTYETYEVEKQKDLLDELLDGEVGPLKQDQN